MTTVGVLFTAYLLLLAAMLAGTLGLASRGASRGAPDRATLSWATALGLQLLAWLLLAARWLLPMPWLEPLACGVLLAGYIEMARALAIEADTPVPGPLVHLPPLLAVIVLAIGHLRGWSIEARLLAFWCCALGAMLVAVWTVRGLRQSPRWWPERSMALIFLLAAPLVVWRAFDQLTAPADGPALRDGMSAVQAVVLVYFVQVPVLATFGFLHMQYRRRSAQMRYLAMHDPLTGLPNRESFLADAHRAMREAARRRRAMSVLMLDVDRFKDINDRYGHAAGDDALRGVAAALLGAVRSSDVATRFGGDEFAVLLPGASPEAALEIAHRIVEGVGAIDLGGAAPGLRVTLSVGIASAQRPGEPLDAVLRRADLRLYEAKDAGRNRVVDAAGDAGSGAVPA